MRTALGLDPYCVDVRYNLGLALARRGQVDEAIDNFGKVLEIKPDFAEAHNGLGRAWLIAAMSTRPSTSSGRPWRLNPTTCWPTNNLAIALASSGHIDEAIDHFRNGPGD